MHVDLFMNLAVQVIRIVLDDSALNGNTRTAVRHTSGFTGFELDPADGYDFMHLDVYDSMVRVNATRHRSGFCAERNRPEHTCEMVDVLDLMPA